MIIYYISNYTIYIYYIIILYIYIYILIFYIMGLWVGFPKTNKNKSQKQPGFGQPPWVFESYRKLRGYRFPWGTSDYISTCISMRPFPGDPVWGVFTSSQTMTWGYRKSVDSKMASLPTTQCHIGSSKITFLLGSAILRVYVSGVDSIWLWNHADTFQS